MARRLTNLRPYLEAYAFQTTEPAMSAIRAIRRAVPGALAE